MMSETAAAAELHVQAPDEKIIRGPRPRICVFGFFRSYEHHYRIFVITLMGCGHSARETEIPFVHCYTHPQFVAPAEGYQCTAIVEGSLQPGQGPSNFDRYFFLKDIAEDPGALPGAVRV